MDAKINESSADSCSLAPHRTKARPRIESYAPSESHGGDTTPSTFPSQEVEGGMLVLQFLHTQKKMRTTVRYSAPDWVIIKKGSRALQKETHPRVSKFGPSQKSAESQRTKHIFDARKTVQHLAA